LAHGHEPPVNSGGGGAGFGVGLIVGLLGVAIIVIVAVWLLLGGSVPRAPEAPRQPGAGQQVTPQAPTVPTPGGTPGG